MFGVWSRHGPRGRAAIALRLRKRPGIKRRVTIGAKARTAHRRLGRPPALDELELWSRETGCDLSVERGFAAARPLDVASLPPAFRRESSAQRTSDLRGAQFGQRRDVGLRLLDAENGSMPAPGRCPDLCTRLRAANRQLPTIRKQQVLGSNPSVGSTPWRETRAEIASSLGFGAGDPCGDPGRFVPS
jgi:hypothetical protein